MQRLTEEAVAGEMAEEEEEDMVEEKEEEEEEGGCEEGETRPWKDERRIVAKALDGQRYPLPLFE